MQLMCWLYRQNLRPVLVLVCSELTVALLALHVSVGLSFPQLSTCPSSSFLPHTPRAGCSPMGRLPPNILWFTLASLTLQGLIWETEPYRSRNRDQQVFETLKPLKMRHFNSIMTLNKRVRRGLGTVCVCVSFL